MSIRRDTLESRIKKELEENLDPTVLNITNKSHLHLNHDSMLGNPHKETHFKIHVQSKMFNRFNQIKRQKMVYCLIKFAFTEGLHAVEMDCVSDLEE